jgi:hypothetical protein
VAADELPKQHHPPHWVVLQLVEVVRDPDWAPEPAAERLLAEARDPHALHRVRASVRALNGDVDAFGRARALVTLDLAISRLENGNEDSAAGGWARGGKSARNDS